MYIALLGIQVAIFFKARQDKISIDSKIFDDGAKDMRIDPYLLTRDSDFRKAINKVITRLSS